MACGESVGREKRWPTSKFYVDLGFISFCGAYCYTNLCSF